MMPLENKWVVRLTDSDHKRTSEHMATLKPGDRFHDNFAYYFTVLSLKDGITVSESSLHNKESDIIKYINKEEFINEYQIGKGKYSIEYLGSVVLDEYWESYNLMDC